MIRPKPPVAALARFIRDESSGAADPSATDTSLDPENWPAFRALAHRMLDAALDSVEDVRDRAVWTPPPEELGAVFDAPVPHRGEGAERVCEEILRDVLPYATGNIHPRFFGWVHGAGSPIGIVAETVAAAMNANVGGRWHGAVLVERQVIEWCRRIFDYPEGASGLLVSGTSMATVIALAVARRAAVGSEGRPLDTLVGYASSEAHSCVAKAFDLLGLGRDGLRKVPVDGSFRMDLTALERAIAADMSAGLAPFCVVGSCGTVNTGAIDDLDALASTCARHQLWFHVDGAFGALAALSEDLRPRLKGIERSDSIGFDFHKWMHVPYDAGCVLVRDGIAHRAAFADRPAYLAKDGKALAGGEPWFCDYGPELSRSFRALKVWAAFKAYGTDRLGASIRDNCRLAAYLADKIANHPRLEPMAPVSLAIVCFRFVDPALFAEDCDIANEWIVSQLQERGIAAPSTTRLRDGLAIRVNITNHRTQASDLDRLVESVAALGAEWLQGRGSASGIAALVYRPELAPLADGIRFTRDPSLDLPFQLARGAELRLGTGFPSDPDAAAVTLRHALELCLWRDITGPGAQTVERLAAGFAACRVAGLYLGGLSQGERRRSVAALEPWQRQAYAMFSTPGASSASSRDPMPTPALAETLLRLVEPKGSTTRGVDAAIIDAALARFATLVPVAAPAEWHLAHGVGSRARLSSETGRNSYGIPVGPSSDRAVFSSSTASPVSASAFQAVEAARADLIRAALTGEFAATYRRGMDDVRRALLAAYGAAGEGATAVLAASGTEAELYALYLARGAHDRQIVNVIVGREETGSSVSLAAQGRHFEAHTPMGATVEVGAPIVADAGAVDVRVVPVRGEEGAPRPACDVNDDVARAVDAAVADGCRCLVHILDASKTGIGGPDADVIRALKRRHGAAIDVVVDACQMRLGASALARYLADGWMVTVTGSKFLSAPPFCGALLVPARIVERVGEIAPLPAAYGAYTTRAAWPKEWGRMTAALNDAPNVGLLLRWRAALHEKERFEAVAPALRLRILERLGIAVEENFRLFPWAVPLVGVPPRRVGIPTGEVWAERRSIFSFLIAADRRQGAGRVLDFEEARRVHDWLAEDLTKLLPRDPDRTSLAKPCFLGHPVKARRMGDGWGGALRIAIGAPLISDIAGTPDAPESVERRLDAAVADIDLVFRKLDLILRHHDTLAASRSVEGASS